MDSETRQEYSRDLGIELVSLKLIQENKYCAIYRVETPKGPRILKKYRGEDPRLVTAEAEALRLYHRLAADDPDLMDSDEPLIRADKNLLCIGFVKGEALNETLYRARNDQRLRSTCVKIMKILGHVIRRLRDTTRSEDGETSPFIFEYLDYCSRRLEGIPILGSVLFKGAAIEAQQLSESLRHSKEIPSFVHGDFVFKNIHVHGDRVGLIDFANTNERSHPLNDIYNLRFALAHMFLPGEFKVHLLESFHAGLGPVNFPETVHRFYYEYHRRRWLMLKLTARSPWEKAQGMRGLLTFARPYNEEPVAL